MSRVPSNRSLARACAAFLLAVIVPVPTAHPSQAAPRIEVEEAEADMGTLVRGEAGQARFTLRNTGDAVLRILDVKPG